MKCSMRMKLVIVGALLAAVFLAGSAWAQTAAEVVISKVSSYGHGLTAAIDQGDPSKVNITGEAKDVTQTLDLGDISELTIDWQATLECTDSDALYSNSNTYGNGKHRDLIAMSGSGNFNITTGSIKLSGGSVPEEDHWPRMVNIGENVQATISGGTLEMTLYRGVAIADYGNKKSTQITIDGGTIIAPYDCAAFATTVTVNGGNITGIVQNNSNDVLDIYGNITIKTPLDDSEAGGGAKLTVKSKAHLTLEADFTFGANTTMMIESSGSLNIAKGVTLDNGGTITSYGTIDIYGTVANKDLIDNKPGGIINNYSDNTLNNQGTLTNNGTLNNDTGGKITNTGTIDNAKGKIVNDGTIDNSSGTIKSDAANFEGNPPIGNPIKPINDDPDSGGGGCNAGLGMVGLLLAGLVVLKRLA